MKKNDLLGYIQCSVFCILFTFLLLFSSTSLAHIPGDFNLDGKVDFEDLMIFALAYGSTPSSSNWDTRCDLHPDNHIDFEDLMLFAMNYGKTSESKIEYSEGYAYTGHLSRSSSRLPEIEHNISSKIHLYPGDITRDPSTRGDIFNAIFFIWNGYYNCEGFRIYRSVNGAAYQLILDWDDLWAGITPDDYFGVRDRAISQGNTIAIMLLPIAIPKTGRLYPAISSPLQ